MKTFSSFFTFCICIVLLSGCAKEDGEARLVIEQSPEEKAKALLVSTPHDILFAAITIDHANSSLKGLLVDKKATLRKVELSDNDNIDFTNDQIVSFDMERIYENSKLIKELSIVETADYFRNSKTLKLYEGIEELSETEDKSHVYVGFKRSNNVQEVEACGEGDHSSQTLSYEMYYQTIISSTGKINQTNSSAVTASLVTWLQSFESEFDDL